MALACFVAARLAADCAAGTPELAGLGRAARSAGAKAWLGALALPAGVRGPLLRCVESTGSESPAAVGRDLTNLAAAGAEYLDPGSRAELEGLASALQG